MKIKVELTNDEIRKLIIQELTNQIGPDFKKDDVHIMVRSKQNYRVQTWERGEFLVTYEGEI